MSELLISRGKTHPRLIHSAVPVRCATTYSAAMTGSADSLADAIDRAIERDRLVRDEIIDHTLRQGERLTAALSQRRTALDLERL